MAAQKSPPAEKYANLKVSFKRTLVAPRALVWKVWTDPKHVAQWWGPEGFTNPRCDWDARSGGMIHIDMRAPDGTVYPMTGTFKEVREPERLVFINSALENNVPLFDVLTTVDFVEKNGMTTVTVREEVLRTIPGSDRYLQGMEAGMNQTLDRAVMHVYGQTKDDSDVSEREIITTRIINAPRELVWDAVTKPEHVSKWWGPNGFTTTTKKHDFRPGGEWEHVMHGPDGVDYPNHSYILEVVRPERFVTSHGGHREDGLSVRFQSTWTFEDQGNKTKVTMRGVFPTAAMLAMVIKEFKADEGGKQTLAKLDDYASNIYNAGHK